MKRNTPSADNSATDIGSSADDIDVHGGTLQHGFCGGGSAGLRNTGNHPSKRGLGLAFKVLDNALYEFGEYRKEAARNCP